ARLLGTEQLNWLKDWISDWSDGVWMKVLLSPSIWTSLLTLPEGWLGDEALWRLPLTKPGEYPPDDRPVADFNSGGWPPAGRDEALKILRQGFAIHITGSNGPPAALKYGLEKFEEAIWAFTSPPLVNALPVRWMPRPTGSSGPPAELKPTGNFEDAFGNKFSLRVVTNPFEGIDYSPGKGPSGFGLVCFEKSSRRITLSCYPYPSEAQTVPYGPYEGWPVTVNQLDNYGRKPVAYLPTLKFKGMTSPVVQVIEEKTGEIVYTLRVSGSEFRPAVYKPGNYLVRCGEPGTAYWKELRGLSSMPARIKKTRVVDFGSGQIKG
ncbi:MAG: twin-arginine translocation pathway signal protein, partial [Candidatus Saccharicenans sp.]